MSSSVAVGRILGRTGTFGDEVRDVLNQTSAILNAIEEYTALGL